MQRNHKSVLLPLSQDALPSPLIHLSSAVSPSLSPSRPASLRQQANRGCQGGSCNHIRIHLHERAKESGCRAKTDQARERERRTRDGDDDRKESEGERGKRNQRRSRMMMIMMMRMQGRRGRVAATAAAASAATTAVSGKSYSPAADQGSS